MHRYSHELLWLVVVALSFGTITMVLDVPWYFSVPSGLTLGFFWHNIYGWILGAKKEDYEPW